jgi:hypothetical protein
MNKSTKRAGYRSFRALGTYSSRPLHWHTLPGVLRPIAIATAQLWMCGCASPSSGGGFQQDPSQGQVPPPMQAQAPGSGTTGGRSATTGGGAPQAGNGGSAPQAGGGGSAPQAGNGGSASQGDGAAPGSAGAGSGGPSLPDTGNTDAWPTGPYAVSHLENVGPVTMAGVSVEPQLTGTNNPTMGQGSVIYPTELGKNGVKHPIVAWGNGSGIQGDSAYSIVTEHVASYGIVVYNSFQSNDGSELLAGIDWLIQENSRSGSIFEGKLDTTKVGVAGHSMGSMAAYAVVSDPRITASAHISGSTGFGTNLHGPALMYCGEDNGTTDLLAQVGDVMAPKVKADFASSRVPTFFAEQKGANHMSNFFNVNGAVAGWFRWQLAGDLVMKKMFVAPPDCGLCTRQDWSVQTKNLN